MPEQTNTKPTPQVKRTETTITKWSHFGRARVRPKKVIVKGYSKLIGPLSAHTTIIPTAEQIINHTKRAPFTEFFMELEFCDTVWEGWNELMNAGVEIIDFRSQNDKAAVAVHPTYIQQRMKPHLNQNRRKQPGGRFLVTLSMEKPIIPEAEVFAEDVPAYQSL